MGRSLKVSKNYLLLMTVFLIVLMPPYLGDNTIMRLLENLAFIATILYVINNKYRPSSFVLCVTVYFLVFLFLTIIAQGRFSIHLIISNLKVVVVVALVECTWRQNSNRIIGIIGFVLALYCLMDFTTIVLYPEGLYTQLTVWNEWSSSETAYWLLGNKNNRLCWYIGYVMFTAYRYIRNNSLINRWKLYLSFIVSIVAMFLINSNTSQVAVILLSGGLLYGLTSRRVKLNIKSKIIIIAYTILNLLIIGGDVAGLTPILQKLFNKSASFNGRTTIWSSIILMIAQKPLFGWGNISTSNMANILNHQSFVNSHNQWLDILVQTGIVGFVVFISLFWLVVRSIDHIKNRNNKLIMQTLLVGLLIGLLFEVVFTTNFVPWIVLIAIYLFSRDWVADERKELIKNE